MKKEQNDIKELLNNIPDEFKICSEEIDISIRKEYFELTDKIDFTGFSDDKLLKKYSELSNPEVPINEKKKILILLSHLGTVKAFRTIQNYIKQPKIKLKKWALLALQECKMHLESYLLDESQGFISTGLGGIQNKLRYYVIILTKEEKVFTSNQKLTVKKIFEFVTKNFNSQIEGIRFSENYLDIKMLVPMDVAIGHVVEEGINKCNEKEDFLFVHYFVTNCNLPSKNEIENIIKEIRN